MDPTLVTTSFEFDGLKIVKYLGIVRGITVRSRGAIMNFAAGFQTILGGNITIYTDMCEHAREEAFLLMYQHAVALGANAVIGMRYDATEVMPGVTEVLAYGTAVVVNRT